MNTPNRAVLLAMDIWAHKDDKSSEQMVAIAEAALKAEHIAALEEAAKITSDMRSTSKTTLENCALRRANDTMSVLPKI